MEGERGKSGEEKDEGFHLSNLSHSMRAKYFGYTTKDD